MAATGAEQLAPSGTLRAAINLGNAVLARRDAATGRLSGVSIDLARALAGQLDVPLEFVTFDTAAESVEAVAREAADVGFFAVDPRRADSVSFTAPYLLIEGCFLVRAESAVRGNDDVDRAGTRIVVGRGSAYDLHLTRHIAKAELVRVAVSSAVVDEFVARQLEVAAGVRQQLESDMRRVAGLRLLPEPFMIIRQAMGLPATRPAGLPTLSAFVERAKAEGLVAQALQANGVQGCRVASAA